MEFICKEDEKGFSEQYNLYEKAYWEQAGQLPWSNFAVEKHQQYLVHWKKWSDLENTQLMPKEME